MGSSTWKPMTPCPASVSERGRRSTPSRRHRADPAAERTLRKLDKPIPHRLVAEIGHLAYDPRPSGVKALAGHPGALRLRVGDYRVVYRVEDKRLLVLVLDLGHRREIYRAG
jgi:mRNA interferase RelE/StbE